MNKQIIGAVLGIALCASGGLWGQSYPATGQSATRHPSSPTPAMRARKMEIWRLDQASAAALDLGKYAQAEAAARQSVSLGLASGRGEELLAAALDAQGKTQEALKVYKAIADEGDVFSRNELPYARLLLKTGQWAQAVAAYNRQLLYRDPRDLMLANNHFSPNVPQPRELAAAIHIGLGRTGGWWNHPLGIGHGDRTLDQFQQALALEPDSAVAHYYYGEALMLLGRRAEAKAMFQKVAGTTQGNVKEASERMLKGL